MTRDHDHLGSAHASSRRTADPSPVRPPVAPGRGSDHAAASTGPSLPAGLELDPRRVATPSALGGALDHQLRLLELHLRRNLTAYAAAATQPERDAALDAIDTRAEVAFLHVPDGQRALFVREARAVLRDALGELRDALAEAEGSHGARAAQLLELDRATHAPGGPLPAALRSKFEASLGADLSEVRVHTGPGSARAASALAARAFTAGRDVHFGASEYSPGTHDGEHLLAHEVAHAVQHDRGTPGVHAKRQVSALGDACEVEADRAADAMVAGERFAVRAAPSAGLARTPHGHHGARRHREASGDAGALDAELAHATGEGIARMQAAQARAAELGRQAEAMLPAIVRAAAAALHRIATWRASIDARALARLDTGYASTAGAIAWEGIDRIADALSALNPMARMVYHAVDAAVTLGGFAWGAYQADRNAALVDAAHAADAIGDGAGGHLLAAILASDHAAYSAVAYDRGLIDGTVQTAIGDARTAETRQHARLAGGHGPVDPAFRGEVEATGAGALGHAAEIDARLAQLEAALRVLSAAPAQITQAGRRVLARAQLELATPSIEDRGAFTSMSPAVETTGTLTVAATPGSSATGVTLSLDGHIGDGELRTPLDANLDDLTAIGVNLDVTLEVRHPELFPQVFAAPAVAEIPHGQLVMHLTGGQVTWSGLDDAALGGLVATRYADSPLAGAGRAPADSPARGAALRDQIESVLRDTPLDRVHDLAL